MTALWTILGKPAVVDLSHFNSEPIDFEALVMDGVHMVIHKATQGVAFVDPAYKARRVRALAAGLKWEAYHFFDSADPRRQVDHFLAVAELDATMRGALDCEPNKGSTITFAEVEIAAGYIDDARGRQAIRYTGAGFLTPQAIRATPRFRSGPIWWAKYGPMPRYNQIATLGINPKDMVLWQETGSGSRLGIHGLVDESYWLGTLDELARYPVIERFPDKGATA